MKDPTYGGPGHPSPADDLGPPPDLSQTLRDATLNLARNAVLVGRFASPAEAFDAIGEAVYDEIDRLLEVHDYAECFPHPVALAEVAIANVTQALNLAVAERGNRPMH